jgi:eukaryotic-like serine/threonine-protein kinase
VTATTADPPAARTAARRGLSLGTRIFVISSLLILVAVGAAVVYTSLRAQQVARQAVLQDLASSDAVQQTLERQRYERLELISRLFVADPYLTAYVAEAATSHDSRSILDLLSERREDLGFDFAIVLDPQGKVLARTDRPGETGDSLAERSLVAEAIHRYQASGVWQEGHDLYYAVAVPLTQGFDLHGFLLTGFAVTDEAARATMRVSGTEVAILASRDGAPEVAATTLDADRTARLTAALHDRPDLFQRAAGRGEVVDGVELSLGGEPWIAHLTPLVDAAGKPVGATVALASLDRELAPYREIERALLIAGVCSVLLAFALTFAFARRALRPIRRLAAAAGAARAGDYDQRIATERGDEVGELSRAFDGLLGELREKRDMETYVAELSRSLPEAGEAAAGPGAAPATPAAAAEATLLAVDFRALPASKENPAAPGEALDAFSRSLRRLAHTAAGRRGRIAAVAGQRALVRFEGAGRSFRALATAADLLAGADEETAPAMALAEGTVTSGSIDWGGDRHPGLLGRPLVQLDGLLREAAAGEIVFPADLYGELRDHFDRAGYELAERRGVLVPRPLYFVTAALAARLAAGRTAVPAAPEPVAASAARTGTRAVAAGRPTLSDLAPGSVVGGRFELLAVLGSGGMGVVYKARDRQLDELVAVKMLRPELWGNAEHVERLKDELKLARKITHPNVLRTFDLDEADGIPFISMEYVRGVTLRYLLDHTGRLPYSAALHLARQLCRGLAAAHAVGVLHRDIKPENLILEPSGNAKLMDFGIARPAVRLEPGRTQAGWLVGTPHYLAPEQLRGAEADRRADIYSAGVVFYEVFTGALPFGGGTPMEVVAQTLGGEPAPPSQHWPEIPAALEGIILVCLNKEPSQRYAEVEQILADLDRLQA